MYTSIRTVGRSILASKSTNFNPLLMRLNALYSADTSLSKEEIEKRILELLKGFDKVAAEKLNATAQFNADLGLDSLDVVEVVMAIEEEFFMEIPDQVADNIRTTQDAVNYIYENQK